jgi:hypothetical protein
MRALTILQPFAHLIVARPEDLAALADTAFGCDLVEAGVSLTPKRIENRPRPLTYEGELLIHAGSRLYGEILSKRHTWRNDDAVEAGLAFGAIVGVVTLRGCFQLVLDVSGYIPPAWADRRWPWLRQDPHVCGPCCLVLDNVHRFRKPLAWRGKQSLWNPETWDSTPQRLAELRQAIEAAEPIDWAP